MNTKTKDIKNQLIDYDLIHYDTDYLEKGILTRQKAKSVDDGNGLTYLTELFVHL